MKNRPRELPTNKAIRSGALTIFTLLCHFSLDDVQVTLTMRDPANAQAPYVIKLQRKLVMQSAAPAAAEERGREKKEGLVVGSTALARELMGSP